MKVRATPRWPSAALFAAAALAFLLPFGTISCGGDESTFTGIELAMYSVPDESIAQDVEREASFPALVALAATLCGLGLAMGGTVRGRGWCAAAAVACFATLAWQASLWGVQTEPGFVLAFFLVGVAWVLEGVAALERRQARRRRSLEPAVHDSPTGRSQHAHQ